MNREWINEVSTTLLEMANIKTSNDIVNGDQVLLKSEMKHGRSILRERNYG